MEYDYVMEKLGLVVDSLATHPGSVQERLWNAWVSQGSRLEAKDFSGDLQTEFASIDTALNEVSNRESGSIKATTLAMEDDTARQLAERIVTLYNSVWRSFTDHEVAEAVKEAKRGKR